MANVGTDSYTLRMIDQLSAPMRSIESQITRVADLMERMSGGGSKGGSGGGGLLGNMSRGMLVAGAGIAAAGFALKGLFNLMEFGVGIAGRLTMGFGRAVIEATKFRTQNIGTLELFLGKGVGRQAFDKGLQIGGITTASETDVVERMSSLASFGLKGEGLSKVLAGSLDIESIFSKEKAEKYTRGISDMLSSTKLEMVDLKQAAQGILDMKQVKANIAGLLGGKGSIDELAKKFESLQKAGIDSKFGVYGVLKTIDDQIDAGKGLGSTAQEKGEGTLAGLLSNLQAKLGLEGPSSFLASIGLEDMPGIKSLMEFLKRILVFFDKGTVQGRQLVAVVERMTNVLFGGLDRISENDLQRFFEGGIRAADRLVDLVQSAWDIVGQMLHGDLSGLTGALGAGIKDVGMLLGQGMYEGFLLAFGGEKARTEQERKRLQAAGLSEGQINTALSYNKNGLVLQRLQKNARATGQDTPLRLLNALEVQDEIGSKAVADLPKVAYWAARGNLGSDPKFKDMGAAIGAGALEGLRQGAKAQAAEAGGGEHDEMLKNIGRLMERRGARP